MPEGIRDTIGQGEIVKSFESSDPKVVKLRHAEFHAGVQRLFAHAKTCAGISSDLVFEAAGGFKGRREVVPDLSEKGRLQRGIGEEADCLPEGHVRFRLS